MTRDGVPQAWIDRATKIETAALGLVEAVSDAVLRAQEGTGRLYRANIIVLDERVHAVFEAIALPEPRFPAVTRRPLNSDDRKNCVTCANREKYVGMDSGGGDFWRCTATPILPAFTGCCVRSFDPPLVNLNSFGPDHPCHDYQHAKTCALWSARA